MDQIEPSAIRDFLELCWPAVNPRVNNDSLTPQAKLITGLRDWTLFSRQTNGQTDTTNDRQLVTGGIYHCQMMYTHSAEQQLGYRAPTVI